MSYVNAYYGMPPRPRPIFETRRCRLCHQEISDEQLSITDQVVFHWVKHHEEELYDLLMNHVPIIGSDGIDLKTDCLLFADGKAMRKHFPQTRE